LLINLVVRSAAFLASGDGWAAVVTAAGIALAVALCLTKRAFVGGALQLFGTSFLLYGFHSYRLSSQALELIVSAFALVLLLRARGQPPASHPKGASTVLLLHGAYAGLAAASLLLLPAEVLAHRLFVEGPGFGRAVLAAFPKDPLYPIAAVGRLWLFLVFAGLLAVQTDGRSLHRRLARGVAWAAITAVALGLLDFAGLLSLDRFNLSNLFYGREYRRLQSTFGNPSWFACFVACALPFVWLEFREARGRARLALAAAFPTLAASLFLSGARAAWLAALVVIVSFVALAAVARRSGNALSPPDTATRLAIAGTVACVALLGAFAWSTPTTLTPEARTAPTGRLEGLSRELQYRGLGLTSPRRVAAAYTLELARQAPLLGLGYETYNLHLRAQLEIPRSAVSRLAGSAAAAEAAETVFDDSHNTYLQVLTGTGVLGLASWFALALAGLCVSLRAFRRNPSPESVAVVLALAVFHFYGLFQGMAYIPVTFLLFPIATGYALTLDAPAEPGTRPRPVRRGLAFALGLAVLAAAWGYASDAGFASLKRRFGIIAYLPEEAAEYEGFYRPEQGAAGEFRWMRERAIVNVRRPTAFRLSFTCEHPDLEREPVVLELSFDGRAADRLVFRRPGTTERRFAFGEPGALRLMVSRTFRPGGADRRELGIAVSAIRWE